MSKGQIIALWVGIFLLVASWLYPPWNWQFSDRSISATVSSAGFSSIFTNEHFHGVDIPGQVYTLDLPKMALIDLSIVVVTGAAIVTLRRR